MKDSYTNVLSFIVRRRKGRTLWRESISFVDSAFGIIMMEASYSWCLTIKWISGPALAI
jgi:hypothetical protein